MRRLVVLVLGLSLGCAAQPVQRRDWSAHDEPGAAALQRERLPPPDVDDPLEPLNRGVWAFNDGLIDWLVAPAGRAYRAVTPRWGRDRLRDFAANLVFPRNFVANLLQGERGGAGRELARFAVNSRSASPGSGTRRPTGSTTPPRPRTSARSWRAGDGCRRRTRPAGDGAERGARRRRPAAGCVARSGLLRLSGQLRLHLRRAGRIDRHLPEPHRQQLRRLRRRPPAVDRRAPACRTRVERSTMPVRARSCQRGADRNAWWVLAKRTGECSRQCGLGIALISTLRQPLESSKRTVG